MGRGLAVSDKGQILLLEAKAHIPEIVTDPTGAKRQSLQRIQESLEAVKSFLSIGSPVDWSACFYQYANHLSHLYWLRKLNSLDAHLINVFFLNDAEMNGPGTVKEWQAAIRLQEVFLGVRQGARSGYALHPWVGAYVVNVFVDTNAIPVRYPTPI